MHCEAILSLCEHHKMYLYKPKWLQRHQVMQYKGIIIIHTAHIIKQKIMQCMTAVAILKLLFHSLPSPHTSLSLSLSLLLSLNKVQWLLTDY
jgi:hypothetical protein